MHCLCNHVFVHMNRCKAQAQSDCGSGVSVLGPDCILMLVQCMARCASSSLTHSQNELKGLFFHLQLLLLPLNYFTIYYLASNFCHQWLLTMHPILLQRRLNSPSNKMTFDTQIHCPNILCPMCNLSTFWEHILAKSYWCWCLWEFVCCAAVCSRQDFKTLAALRLHGLMYVSGRPQSFVILLLSSKACCRFLSVYWGELEWAPTSGTSLQDACVRMCACGHILKI